MKRKPSKAAAIAAAKEALSRVAGPLGSMDDFAETFAASGVSGYTTQDTFKLLCDQVRDAYADAADALAHTKNPVIPFLRKAADALDRAECLTEYMANDSDELTGKEGRIKREMFGSALRSFVCESGRWYEMAIRTSPALTSFNHGWIQCLVGIPAIPKGRFEEENPPQ